MTDTFTPSADPDAPLVEAWALLRQIEHDFNTTDADDTVVTAWALASGALEQFIARSPRHGATGIAVKLEMLAHLFEEQGTVADWELDLTRSVLAVLPQLH